MTKPERNMTKEIEPCYRALGARIEHIRKVLGLTQHDLAARLKLTRASIANIETGRQRVLMHTCDEIAAALGTTTRGLMKGVWPL